MIFCPSWALNWNKSIVIVIVLPLKQFSFSSTPLSFNSTVITLSRDIVHKIEKLTFAGIK